VVAGGPSVKQNDVDRLKGRARVIVINDAWKLCPWADMLYAADWNWWTHHEYVPSFAGAKWTQAQGHKDWPRDAKAAGLFVVASAGRPGFSTDPKKIHTGKHSGFQAINISLLKGASRILLLGFDYGLINGERHWFGDHPGRLNKNSPYNLFKKELTFAIRTLVSDVELINCSTMSTLSCLKKTQLIDCL